MEYQMRYLVENVDPRYSTLFVERAFGLIGDLKHHWWQVHKLNETWSSRLGLRLIRGIVLKGGTPPQALLALVRVYTLVTQGYHVSKTVRVLILRLVAGAHPAEMRVEEEARNILCIDEWCSNAHQLKRQYWNYAMASRELQDWYGHLTCNVAPDSKYRCEKMQAGPLLLWVQRKAWSEIRYGLALSVGRRLSPEEFEMVFAAALELEGVPRRPTLEMLVKGIPSSCKLRAQVEELEVSKFRNVRRDDEADLFDDVDVGDEDSSYLKEVLKW
jgi:hypothetical protein